jgi:hypothetical protein
MEKKIKKKEKIKPGVEGLAGKRKRALLITERSFIILNFLYFSLSCLSPPAGEAGRGLG